MIFLRVSLFTFIVYCVASEDSIYCTTDSCEDPTCPTLPKACNESISSSGIYMLSPTVCNCCTYCIAYLSEGDACTTGSDTADTPTTICGPGLYCDQDTQKCRGMTDTKCYIAQAKYDQDKMDGNIGDYQTRPNCDDDGNYVPYHCIPGGICYCVDNDGNRIFGSAANNGKAKYDLPCDCSRNFVEMGTVLGRDLQPGEYFRCASNGAYEPLQCLDEKTCICVDESDGSPVSDSTAAIEMSALAESTPSCFDSSKNVEGAFYRRCEEIFMKKTKEIAEKKTDNNEVLAYELPSCTPDGNYAPVQENHKYKFCSTSEGIALLSLEKTSETEELRENMNCKCIMANRLTTSSEKPSCLENGNYNSTQCRRGSCFSVDEDGNQVIL